jgi:hypothetical protein
VKLYRDLVSAAVLVVRRVQRLVHVAEEVNQEHQRFPASFRPRRGVAQDPAQAGYGGQDAFAVPAIAPRLEIAFGDRDVYEVQPRCFPA